MWTRRAPSAGALAFALRCMRDVQALRVIGTVRSGSAAPMLANAFPPEQVVQLGVDAMSVGAIYQLLHARLALRLPRPLLVQIHKTAAGNPLHALELGRVLGGACLAPSPGQPLPVPGSLDALIGLRINSLPIEVRMLSTAAAWRFTDRGNGDVDGLSTAVDAGLVVVKPADDGVRVIRARRIH